MKEWSPQQRFIDVQTKGPYALWHHQHFFESVAEGVRITDCVDYRLPFAMITNPIIGNFVRRDIERIFNYRQSIIAQQFILPI